MKLLKTGISVIILIFSLAISAISCLAAETSSTQIKTAAVPGVPSHKYSYILSTQNKIPPNTTISTEKRDGNSSTQIKSSDLAASPRVPKVEKISTQNFSSTTTEETTSAVEWEAQQWSPILMLTIISAIVLVPIMFIAVKIVEKKKKEPEK